MVKTVPKAKKAHRVNQDRWVREAWSEYSSFISLQREKKDKRII